MRTVVFDLDGTLADTSGDLLAAANACFRGLGHGDVLNAGDAGTALRGGRAMLTLGFDRLGVAWDEADVAREYPILLRAYRDAIDVYTVLYPGVVDALEVLRGQGYGLAICTNKPEALAEVLMGRLGVRDLFGALIGADTLPTRKPDVAPYHAAVAGAGGTVARSLMVGDTETDHLTARGAGVPSVLVSFGPEGAGVVRLAPDAMLDHYDDLAGIVGRLLA
jgi:phosphoglycolate phosphatase